VPASGAAGNASFFRTDFRAFRSMGATKVQLALSMLEGNPRVEVVVVSDSGEGQANGSGEVK
jgi:hypothetical protein